MLQDAVERAALQVPGPGSPLERVAGQLTLDEDPHRSSGGAPGVPYYSRRPLVSLVQSHLEEAGDPVLAGRADGLWSRLVRDVERLLGLQPGSLTPEDPNWYVAIAKGVLERFALGNHPFNPAPAALDVSDSTRIVVVGDWGTGLPPARDVAAQMRTQIAEALGEGREAHVIHLGDVYYSGLENEDQRRFLDLWPVSPAQAEAGVTSWSLNGHHDMYSGGHAYFGTLLGDPRFSRQRSADGRTTSWFRLRSPSWDFVGLDTAWDADVASSGARGVLQDPQAAQVGQWAADPQRRTVLFSHHQLVSYYERKDVDGRLAAKLAPVLGDGRVAAWWWGHEHRAITYEPAGGVRFPRCLGNGGMPIRLDADPPPGSEPAITWHSTRHVWRGGHRWARSGFAVIDVEPAQLSVRYVDDDGAVPRTETIIV